MEFAARGMQGGGNYERMMMESQNTFLTESRSAKYRLNENYRRSDQREQFIEAMGFQADQSLAGIGAGLSADASQELTGRLGRDLSETFLGISEGVQEGDVKKIMGTRLLENLRQSAAAGDQAAARALANLGSTPEEQQRNANMYAAQHLNDMVDARGESLQDMRKQFGDAAIEGGLRENEIAKAKSFASEVMADTTNQDISDPIRALSQRIADMAGQGMDGSQFVGLLDAAFKTNADPAIQEQIKNSIDAVQALQAELDSMPEESGQSGDSELSRHRARQKAALEKETKFLYDQLKPIQEAEAAAAANDPEQKAAAGGATAGKDGSVTLNNVTFNIGDEFLVQIAKASSDKSVANATGNV